MSTAASRRLSTGVAWGAFGVLAWATLSILVGGNAAHAQEDDDGLLGDVASVLNSTASETTDLVGDVAAEVIAPVVTEVIAPTVQETAPAAISTVTDTAVSLPVIGDVVTPIVTPIAEAADKVVPSITTPVGDLLQDSPVASITDPVLDIVSDVPLVGDLLDDVGVMDAVGDVVGIVDSTADLLGTTVEAAVPPVLDAVHPPVPTPGLPGSQSAPEAEISTAAPIEIEPTIGAAVGEALISSAAPAAASAGPALAQRTIDLPGTAFTPIFTNGDATGVPASPAKAAHAPPASPGPSSSSAGHGGGSASDGARLAGANADSLRAWKRTLGIPDDDLPSSPVSDTDTSPD